MVAHCLFEQLEEENKWYIAMKGTMSWSVKAINKDKAIDIVRKGGVG